MLGGPSENSYGELLQMFSACVIFTNSYNYAHQAPRVVRCVAKMSDVYDVPEYAVLFFRERGREEHERNLQTC